MLGSIVSRLASPKKILGEKKCGVGWGGSCHGQTDHRTDRRHRRVTSRVAPCEQQGPTKMQVTLAVLLSERYQTLRPVRGVVAHGGKEDIRGGENVYFWKKFRLYQNVLFGLASTCVQKLSFSRPVCATLILRSCQGWQSAWDWGRWLLVSDLTSSLKVRFWNKFVFCSFL